VFTTKNLRRFAVLLILALPACSGAGTSVGQIPTAGSAAAAASTHRTAQSGRAFAASCLAPNGRVQTMPAGTPCPAGWPEVQ
jgi:hypothetical protein